MTPAHAQRLAALLSESSLLEDLLAIRPKLGGTTMEEVQCNALRAEGFEDCVAKLKGMTAIEGKPPTRPFVDTNKGFK